MNKKIRCLCFILVFLAVGMLCPIVYYAQAEPEMVGYEDDTYTVQEEYELPESGYDGAEEGDFSDAENTAQEDVSGSESSDTVDVSEGAEALASSSSDMGNGGGESGAPSEEHQIADSSADAVSSGLAGDLNSIPLEEDNSSSDDASGEASSSGASTTGQETDHPDAKSEEASEQAETAATSSEDTAQEETAQEDPDTANTATSLFGPSPRSTNAAITFMVDGAVYHTETVLKNTLISMPPDPLASNPLLPFAGWVKGDGTYFNPFHLITEDIVLEARFTDNHIVTFYDSNHRIILDIVEVIDGDPVAPTAEDVTLSVGQTVAGWKENGAVSYYDFDDPVHSSLSLYPEVKDRAQAVFVTNGSEVSPQVGEDGFFAVKPAVDPTRVGYTFKGWVTAQGGATPFDFDTTPIVGTVFVYASWEAQKVGYYINYYVEVENFSGDPLLNPNNYELAYTRYIKDTETLADYAGVSKTITATQANSAYVAGGANITNVLNYCDFRFSTTETLIGDGSTIINVYYARTVFTFHFNLDKAFNISGTYPYSIVLKDGTVHTGGTYTLQAKLGQDILGIWPSAVIWPHDSRKFINWGGYYGNSQPYMSASSIAWAMGSGRPSARTKTLSAQIGNAAYSEVRYYHTEVLPGDPFDKAYAAPSGPDISTRYYKLSQISGKNYQTGNPASSAKNWPGREIEGFEQISTALTKYYQVVEADPAENEAGVTAYRINYFMRRKSYSLTLATPGGGFAATPVGFTKSGESYTAAVLYEDEIELPTANPEKLNSTFAGWYMDENCTVPFVPGMTMPSKAITLYAKFTSLDVVVNYYDQGALIGNYTYGHRDILHTHAVTNPDYTVTGVPVPGKGYFKGWYYIPAGSSVMVEFSLGTTLVSPQYDLHASWEETKYTVTYMDQGIMLEAQAIESAKNTVALSGYLLPVPTARPGYRFVGFNTQADESGTWFYANTPVMADVTVYAIWEKLYTIDLSKTAIGELADLTKAFQFEVELLNSDGSYYTEPVEYVVAGGASAYITTGKVAIQLKHGQTAQMLNVPEDVVYQITEQVYTGYTTYVNPLLIVGIPQGSPNHIIRAAAQGANDVIDVAFYNVKGFVPPTGINIEQGAAILLLVIGLGGLGATFILRRRKRT